MSPEKEEELRQRLRREIEEELRLLHLEEADQKTMKGNMDKGFFVR